MTKTKLQSMPYAQAHIIFDDNGTHLISYTTEVLHVDPQGFLTVFGLYSATTRRHISAFMREYTLGETYQTAKKAYENGYKYNIYTGEIADL